MVEFDVTQVFMMSIFYSIENVAYHFVVFQFVRLVCVLSMIKYEEIFENRVIHIFLFFLDKKMKN